MSINTSNRDSLGSDATLDKVINQVLGGYQPDALARLKKCNLFTDEQIAKIQETLQEVNSTHPIITPQALKDRILIALNPDIKITQTLPQVKIEHHCFIETPAYEFANAYPCTIEFGGKNYQNAVACFLAQQYTDQPHIIEFFTQCETAEEALFLSSTCLMTPERKVSWENPYAKQINKNDVMMHVQRAKFGQNPKLKQKLLDVSGMYLVCQGNDPYWSDCFNGVGQNQLGISLMRLQREYNGANILEPSISYTEMTLDLKNRCHFIVPQLNDDVTSEIFKHCFSGNNVTDIYALACTNTYFYRQITKLVGQLNLNKLCPGLRILDAQTLKIEIDDEPPIRKLATIQCFQDMALQVENNAGLTLLTMPKGLTLNQLMAIAASPEIGITITVLWEKILEELGDVPVEHTYRVMITNNVFINSRNKPYGAQEKFLLEIGCEMPTVQEYVALCIFTKKIFNICLYGQNPTTFGRSSTCVKGSRLIVGGSDLKCLAIHHNNVANYQPLGAGGRRK